MPFRLGHLHLHAFAIGLLPAIGRGETSHTCVELVGRKHEVERGDVAGHGHVAVVGEDGGQTPGILG